MEKNLFMISIVKVYSSLELHSIEMFIISIVSNGATSLCRAIFNVFHGVFVLPGRLAMEPPRSWK